MKQVGAPRDRDERPERHRRAEIPRERAPKHGQSREEVREPRQGGGVLIVEREAVTRQIGPACQQIGNDHERQHEHRHADRETIHPAVRARPSHHAGERGISAAAPILRERLERRVVVDEP